MNTTELYEQLVTSLTDAILDEAYSFKQGGIQGIRIAASEAGPRRPAGGVKPRDPRDISDATRSEHARLKQMLDSNEATRKDGSTFVMPKGLRDNIQRQFNAVQAMIGATPEGDTREAAASKLDAIIKDGSKTERPITGEDAFNALFSGV